MRMVRIGIDVGGTFTDAVALDDRTHALLGQAKTPTTHSAPEGVALGIVHALRQLMDGHCISPGEVRFIAHGTTQATNALLEGDVAKVGIIATGSGVEGMRARSETAIEDVELAPGRFLSSSTRFLRSDALPAGLQSALAELRAQDVRVIVAAAPFSVDDPTLELEIMEGARVAGFPAVGTHELTKLYGLRMRTRTAVVNASILPRMVETADRTAASVKATGITAPLMVMRCDGGVMTVDEMRRRPILTVLSGPAAGVAGALLYEKISRGIFLEIGGTSTDLSAIRDGRVMVDYAEVGGHKTYVSSLDVRTVGVAGGSMIRLDSRQARVGEVGPRSAHIAGLSYSVYSDPAELGGLTLEQFAPMEGDPADYVCVRNSDGKRFALTTACAANLLGYAKQGDYAFGDPESARLAFAPLAAKLNTSVEEAARSVLAAAARKIVPVIESLLGQYGLDRASATLVGGGGGSAALAPFLAETLGMAGRLARSHEVISPIGVALAMVREVVERTIVTPTPDDLVSIKKEAEEAAVRSGADASTVSVIVEVDSARNLVRAVATGATEMHAHDLNLHDQSEPELRTRASQDLGGAAARLVAHAGRWYVYEGIVEEKRFLWKRTRRRHRVLNAEGVICLARDEAETASATVATWSGTLDRMLQQTTCYGDSGAVLPETYLLCGSRLLDLSGGTTRDQMHALAGAELEGHKPEESLVILCVKRA